VDPDRWLRLNELFLAAIEQDPDRRAAFLDEVCAGNSALRAEVESLVVSHEQAGSFMEAPAYEAEAEGAGADLRDELVGRRLGQAIGTLFDPTVDLVGQRYRLFDVGGLAATAGLAITLVIAVIRNVRALYQAEPLPALAKAGR
jgi:hypothetical protein